MRLIVTCALVAITSWSATAAQAEELKVAYLPCGNVNDKSWTQVGYEGVLAAQKDLAKSGTTMKLDYTESLSPAQVEAAARDYASRDYNIVVLHCGPFANAAAHTASAFPKTTVLSVEVPTDAERPPNFWYYDIAQQEVQFAAGVLAALTTKSGRVAALASFDFPYMSRQVEGFVLGVRYANDKVKYSRAYINSWTDAAKAKEAALAAIDAGADVILADTDQAARGVFSAAEGSGRLRGRNLLRPVEPCAESDFGQRPLRLRRAAAANGGKCRARQTGKGQGIQTRPCRRFRRLGTQSRSSG